MANSDSNASLNTILRGLSVRHASLETALSSLDGTACLALAVAEDGEASTTDRYYAVLLCRHAAHLARTLRADIRDRAAIESETDGGAA